MSLNFPSVADRYFGFTQHLVSLLVTTPGVPSELSLPYSLSLCGLSRAKDPLSLFPHINS